MVPVNKRDGTSLAACVAHVLGIDPAEVPDDGGVGLRQWLARRKLGLVPVESPEGFEWPGRFLGLRRGSSIWAVLFGAPPGVVFDPTAISDAGAAMVLDAAFVLAEHDPLRGEGRQGSPVGVGTVELISLSTKAEGPMTVVSAAEAVAGRGLRGDRYERGAGTFSTPNGRGYDLTLVEAEALEELVERGVNLAPEAARRNLVVRGVTLDDLIGEHFRVGEVECFGQRRCEPCAHLERLTSPGVLRGLVHRGGLRADALSDGRIQTGDRLKAVGN